MLQPTDRSIDAIARANHGVITADRALRAGASHGFIHRRVSAGAWKTVARGVYVLGSSPDTWRRRVAIAVLSVPDAAARGRTAAVLHGYAGFSRPVIPEVITHHTASGRSDLAVVMRSEKFPVMQKTEVAGIRVLDPVETIFNIARRTSAERLARMVDDTLLRGLAEPDDIAEVYERYEGTRLKGIRRLRPIVLDRIGGAHVPNESELEFLLDDLLDHHQIPPATRQHRPEWLDGGRVDRWIAKWRIVVEADGRAWHSRSADFERDRERDNAAAAAGAIVMRFTHSMLTESMAACRTQLIKAGARR